MGQLVLGSPAVDALRSHLADVFQRFDLDHNGKLDAIEFREAMKEMGDELSAQSVKIIFNSLDIRGCVLLSAEAMWTTFMASEETASRVLQLR